MPKLQKYRNRFTSGSITPLMRARNDLEQYNSGAKELRNCYSSVYGGVTRRPGTAFIDELSSLSRGRKIPFIFSDLISYVIEFVNNVAYIIRDKQYVLDGLTNEPLVVFTHTYTEAELQDMTFAGVDNSVYLAHPSHPVAQVINGGDDFTWTLSDVPISVRALTSFQFTTVALKFRIIPKTQPFVVNSVFTFTTDGNGNVTSGPTLSGGGNGDMVNLEVDSTFDPGGTWTLTLVLDEGETVRQEWALVIPASVNVLTSLLGNHPGAVTVYEQRLILGGSNFDPQGILMSKSGLANYQTFTIGPNDNDAIQVTISGTEYDKIKHMAAGPGGLLVFTTENNYTVLGAGGFGLAPNNVLIRKNSDFGSREAAPMQIANEFIYISKNKYVRSTKVAATTSPEVSVLAEHLIREGGGIIRAAYAKDPDNIVWMLRADGKLVSMTILREQNIISFSIHDTGTNGDDLFEDVVVIPSPTFDQVYLTVRRSINGSAVRYSEYFDYDTTVNQVNKMTTDCSLYYTNAVAFTTPPGAQAGFLEGETVDILTRKDSEAPVGDDVEAQQVVVGNTFTLPLPVNSLKYGIPFVPTVEMLLPEIDNENTTLSSAVRIYEMFLLLDRTLGANVQFLDDKGNIVSEEDINFLDPSFPTDIPLPVFTGNKKLLPGLGWANPYTIRIQQKVPMPFTLLSVLLEIMVNRP